MVAAELAAQLQRRLQAVDVGGEHLALGLQAQLPGADRQPLHVRALVVVVGKTVEAGGGQLLQVILHAGGVAVGMDALHRPHRLKDQQRLRHWSLL
ncbi:hypothetical protein D3C72_2157240 [compost metagenome]